MTKCPYTATKTVLKPWLEKLTGRIARLPVVRGFPVPWFVAWISKTEPEFRAMDPRKFRKALERRLCWVCGEPLGFYGTFVAGPMCGINRVSSEPPSHLECARWSARNCPFLTLRQAERREDEDTVDMKPPGGVSIKRNPGVAMLWTTPTWRTFADGSGGILIRLGEPTDVEWFARGRSATRAEVLESVRTGLPFLEETARQEWPDSVTELAAMKTAAEKFYPAV